MIFVIFLSRKRYRTTDFDVERKRNFQKNLPVIFKEKTPPKNKEVFFATYDAAIKEAEKVLRLYSATLGRFAE